MFRANFVLFVVVGVFLSTIAAGQQRCPADQEWTTCGSACPPSCNSSPEDKVCTLQCIVGCQCKEGLLLNSSGNCVPREKC